MDLVFLKILGRNKRKFCCFFFLKKKKLKIPKQVGEVSYEGREKIMKNSPRKVGMEA